MLITAASTERDIVFNFGCFIRMFAPTDRWQIFTKNQCLYYCCACCSVVAAEKKRSKNHSHLDYTSSGGKQIYPVGGNSGDVRLDKFCTAIP
jgi:hypothetical protein